MRKTLTKILLVSIILLWFGSVNGASANYTRNINDEIKVFNIEKKVDKILSKYSIEKQKIRVNVK